MASFTPPRHGATTSKQTVPLPRPPPTICDVIPHYRMSNDPPLSAANPKVELSHSKLDETFHAAAGAPSSAPFHLNIKHRPLTKTPQTNFCSLL